VDVGVPVGDAVAGWVVRVGVAVLSEIVGVGGAAVPVDVAPGVGVFVDPAVGVLVGAIVPELPPHPASAVIPTAVMKRSVSRRLRN